MVKEIKRVRDLSNHYLSVKNSVLEDVIVTFSLFLCLWSVSKMWCRRVANYFGCSMSQTWVLLKLIVTNAINEGTWTPKCS